MLTSPDVVPQDGYEEEVVHEIQAEESIIQAKKAGRRKKHKSKKRGELTARREDSMKQVESTKV